MSTLTPQIVRSTNSDQRLFQLLGAELQRRLPAGRSPTDAFVMQVWTLPIGLRAMACTYDLDVSLTLDDLGWHFGNWHHRGLAEETTSGLRELGLKELADVFNDGLALTSEYWTELGRSDWVTWYRGSEFERRIQPLARQARELSKAPKSATALRSPIFNAWVMYARKHPDRVT